MRSMPTMPMPPASSSDPMREAEDAFNAAMRASSSDVIGEEAYAEVERALGENGLLGTPEEQYAEAMKLADQAMEKVGGEYESQPIGSDMLPAYRDLAMSIARNEAVGLVKQFPNKGQLEFGADDYIAYAASKVPPEHLGEFLEMVREESAKAQTTTQKGVVGKMAEAAGAGTSRIVRNLVDADKAAARVVGLTTTEKTGEWEAVYGAIERARREPDPLYAPGAGLVEQGLIGAAENIPGVAASMGSFAVGMAAVP